MLRGRLGSATIAVLTITREEFDAAVPIFSTRQNIIGTPYFVEAISSEHEYDIVVRQATDRGNVPAPEAVDELLEALRPEFVLVIGTAGGISGRDGTQLGDVIVADFISYGEFEKLVGGKALQRYFPLDHPSLYLRASHAQPLSARSDWAESISTERPIAGEPKVIMGHILAVERVLSDPTNEYQRQLLERHDKALAVDMESAGVGRKFFAARWSVHYNPQYLVVRGVSDLVDDPHTVEELGRRWRAYAANAAAAFGVAIAKQVLAAPIHGDWASGRPKTPGILKRLSLIWRRVRDGTRRA